MELRGKVKKMEYYRGVIDCLNPISPRFYTFFSYSSIIVGHVGSVREVLVGDNLEGLIKDS